MPTIDQLQAAIASADTDELATSQNGDTRKVTRAQLLAGLQPAISVPPGALLGNSTGTASAPLPVTVGVNLTLANGILAAPAPFVISSLASGTPPAPTDLVALSQGGTANAVSYSTFLSSLATLPGFDASPLHAMATGATTSRTFAALLGDTVSVEDFGAAGNGSTDDSAAFHAAIAVGLPIRLGPKSYVVNGPLPLSSATCLTLIGVPGQTTLRRLTQSSGSSWITLTASLIHVEGIIFDANVGLTGPCNCVTVVASCVRSTFQRCSFTNAVSGDGLVFSTSDPVFARHAVIGCEAFGNSNGISCAAADGVTVSACHLHDNTVAGIYVDYIDPNHVVKTRLTTIVGNQCSNNQIGIVVGDYATSYASPASITNETADATVCLVASNICHDNTEYGIVSQGYNILIHGNVVYNNGGSNLNNGGILANSWASSITNNIVTSHQGFGIDAGAANFTLIAGNLVTTSRIGINAGGAQEPRISGNFIANTSYYAVVIYNNETNAGGLPIGVPSVDVSITENTIDMPLGGGGILLIDGPQQVQVARNNFITAPSGDISLCLLPLTNTVTVEGNLLNGSGSVFFSNPYIPGNGNFVGLNSLLYPDVVDGISIQSNAAPIQSLRSLNANNYDDYVTFVTLTAGGTGYTSAPKANFSGGGGSGAVATAFITNGVVIGFRMVSLGSGYTSAPTVTLSGGGGSGATATAFIGIPVPKNRRLRVFCAVAAQWSSAGTNPIQATGSGVSITTPANSEIEWVGLNAGWYASRYQQTDYVQPGTDGSVTLTNLSGDMRMHPSGSGAVRWVNDGQATGCTTSVGTGTPQGVVTAQPGSDYRNLTGAAGSVFWIKQTGTGAAGWVAIA
ncbi:right-handed parallel beta-helix repeat-containing protein [Acidisoma sp.]|uniref:right-handed parallel beta-helix repeat-containing protein n=1 Tax=Acidisoma sp. TaxID=1872115 RepID=UPI003B005554